ncbi:MAG: hypothetical protein EB051_00395 [Chlamydiia bacterium]|nr:hypothetical protein [Chlamydiia bacterium]
MDLLLKEDKRRKLIEMHIEAVKKRISPQTGFLHLFYEDPLSLHQQTIPFLENMYYVLGLCRTRLTDPILEARQLLDKLLAFEVEGNFPIYLHEYPLCKNRSLSIELLPVLYYLERDYCLVLGEDLLKRLKALSSRIVDRAEKIHEIKKLPFSPFIKWQAYIGRLLPQSPSTLQEWGDYLLAMHMIQGAHWILDEVRRAISLWNPMNQVLLIEGLVPLQDGFAPKKGLFNLFMDLYSDTALKELLIAEPLLLSGSLVHPFDDIEPAELFNMDSFVVHKANGSKQPLSLYWNEEGSLRSMAFKLCSTDVVIENKGQAVSLVCVYDKQVPEEEGAVEVYLYIDCQEKASLIVNGAAASTFRIDDLVQIQTEHRLFTLHFSVIEGQGLFCGHLSKGNRPSQTRKQLYKAYDWQIGLRTIQRGSRCVMQLAIV